MSQLIARLKEMSEARGQHAADRDTWREAARRLEELEEVARQHEFLIALADGGELTVNGIPWREAYLRVQGIAAGRSLGPRPSQETIAAAKGFMAGKVPLSEVVGSALKDLDETKGAGT